MSDLPDSLEKKSGPLFGGPRAMRPVLPVAGFWTRGLAFGADLALLGAIFYILLFVAKEALFPLDLWNAVLCSVIVFAYFLVCDGPVFKGQTVGKKLMGVYVVTESGKLLDWPAAIIRTALKLEIVVLQLPLLFYLRGLEQNPDLPFYTLAGVLIYGLTMGILTLAWACHLGLSPTKQAPYDLIAHSMVRKMGEEATIENIVELYENPEQVKKMRRNAILWTVAICVGFGFLFGRPAFQGYSDFAAKYIEDRKDFLTTFEIDPYGYPIWDLLVGPIKIIRVPAQPGADADATPTDLEPELGKQTVPNSADAATTAALERPPAHIKIRLQYRWKPGMTLDEIENDQDRLIEQLVRFREWLYKKPEFQEGLKFVVIDSFQLAIVRDIPMLLRPHSEDFYLLELDTPMEDDNADELSLPENSGDEQ